MKSKLNEIFGNTKKKNEIGITNMKISDKKKNV